MNLFDETNAPYAVPLKYRGLELVRYNKRSREQPFTYVTESWDESVDIEMEKLRAIEQKRIDEYWHWKDLGDAGDNGAAVIADGYRYRFNPPKSRVAETVFIENWFDGWLKFYAKCRQCGSPMAISSRIHKYCTPACLRASKAAKQQPFNRARPKVEHTPKACDQCHELFTPKRTDARFCATRCRVAHSRSKQNSVS